ncbi:MAG: AMP-binding protein, partial [Halobacteria archaeon]|nr:AMP-binding protein [Halobacteria archaeon]
MQDIVHNLAAGFREIGVEKGDRIGIFCSTRMEWAQSDLALLSAGGVVTTVYTSSSPNQIRYLLNDPGATGVVVENEELLERTLEAEDDLNLEFIVSVDEISEEHRERDDIYTLADVHEIGSKVYDRKEHEKRIDEIDVEDLASLIYTSGTTGKPKGVKLTHWNFRSNINQARKRWGPRPDKESNSLVIDDSITTISFLPLAHVFERNAGHFFPLASGVTIAYAENPDTVADDFKKVKPDGMTSVPRVYERIYDQMREQASGSKVKERVLNWAIELGQEYYEEDDPGIGLQFKHFIADKLVYSQVNEELGGNVKGFVSGGGTLSEDLAKLYQAMELPIFEGYGLTETSPVVTGNPVENAQPGTVGPPLVDVDVRVDKTVVTPSRQEKVEGE